MNVKDTLSQLRDVPDAKVKDDKQQLRQVDRIVMKVGSELRVVWQRLKNLVRGWIFTSDGSAIKTSDGFYIKCSDQ